MRAVDRSAAQIFNPTESRPTLRRCSGDNHELAVRDAEAKRIVAGALGEAGGAGRELASVEDSADDSCRGFEGSSSEVGFAVLP